MHNQNNFSALIWVPVKAKLEPTIIPVGEIPDETQIAKVALQSKGLEGLIAKVLVGNQVWVVNESDKDVTIADGATILGFGVGSFKMEQPTEEDGVNPNFYQFVLKNSSDEVGHSNKLKTVLDVIKDF